MFKTSDNIAQTPSLGPANLIPTERSFHPSRTPNFKLSKVEQDERVEQALTIDLKVTVKRRRLLTQMLMPMRKMSSVLALPVDGVGEAATVAALDVDLLLAVVSALVVKNFGESNVDFVFTETRADV